MSRSGWEAAVEVATPESDAELPKDASTLYSRNLTTFVLTFWNDKEKQFNRKVELNAGLRKLQTEIEQLSG